LILSYQNIIIIIIIIIIHIWIRYLLDINGFWIELSRFFL